MNNLRLRSSMNSPQVSGKPKNNFIVVFALFGFMVLIVTHYIIKSYSSDVASQPTITANNVTNQLGETIPIQNINSASSSQRTLNGSSRKQVFNLKKNIFALDDAEAACGVFGADVASIDQLIDAHKQGADWCNVGWTRDGIK